MCVYPICKMLVRGKSVSPKLISPLLVTEDFRLVEGDSLKKPVQLFWLKSVYIHLHTMDLLTKMQY